MRIVVDLPAPFGPSRPRQMPAGTSRSRPSTAVIGPKRFTTPCNSIAGTTLQTTYSTTGERTLRIFRHAYKEKVIARDYLGVSPEPARRRPHDTPRTRQHNITAAQWSPNGGSLGTVDLTQPSNYP